MTHPSSLSPPRCPSSVCFSPGRLRSSGRLQIPRSFGGFVLANLERFGYPGAIHLVSRSSAEINARRLREDGRRSAGRHRCRRAGHPRGRRARCGAFMRRPARGRSRHLCVRLCRGRRGRPREAGATQRHRQRGGHAAARPELHGLHSLRSRRAADIRAGRAVSLRRSSRHRRLGAERRDGRQPARCIHRPRPGDDRGGVHRQRGSGRRRGRARVFHRRPADARDRDVRRAGPPAATVSSTGALKRAKPASPSCC